MRYTETFRVYRPTQTVKSDLNVVVGPVAPVGTLTGNLQRGSKGARDVASQLGVFDRQSALCFFPVGSEASLGDRYVLQDEKNALWLLLSGPTVRDRLPGTAHVWAFCVSLTVRPAGVI